ncbi:MAG: response regulator [Rhodospirillaceae bacterium]|nr:response regulator [Rhodospirillaceae bacterium]
MVKLSQNESPAHILVVDDDKRLRRLIQKYLKEQGFLVTGASSAHEARQHMASLQFDLIVLDVMMPGEDGMSFAGAVRADSEIPILMLTAMGEAEHRIQGLEHGVDDYMGKPFEPRELLLRVNAILRRTPPPPDDSMHELSFGECRYDIARNTLVRNGASVHLTSAEAVLLRALALNANTPVQRSHLSSDENGHTNPRTIDVQVTRLRRKIESDPRQPRYLQTVRGTGYLLRTD